MTAICPKPSSQVEFVGANWWQKSTLASCWCSWLQSSRQRGKKCSKSEFIFDLKAPLRTGSCCWRPYCSGMNGSTARQCPWRMSYVAPKNTDTSCSWLRKSVTGRSEWAWKPPNSTAFCTWWRTWWHTACPLKLTPVSMKCTTNHPKWRLHWLKRTSPNLRNRCTPEWRKCTYWRLRRRKWRADLWPIIMMVMNMISRWSKWSPITPAARPSSSVLTPKVDAILCTTQWELGANAKKFGWRWT